MNITHIAPEESKIPGGWVTEQSVPLIGCLHRPLTTKLADNVFRIDNFMNPLSVLAFNEMMKTAPHIAPVSIQGLQEVTPETTGSWRTTMFNIGMAKQLEKLFNWVDFPRNREFNEFSSTDFWQGDKNRRKWEYVGVSPMCRYMTYLRNQGEHFAHYDAGYIYPDDNYRTLMSFVLYLSDNNTGKTRIIRDNQQDIPVWSRDHSDWTRRADKSEVIVESTPVRGSLLLFDHRICHDVSPFVDDVGERRIMRGDLIFKSC